MTERILGEAGPKRKRRFRFIFLPILLGAALALMMAGGAQAVHDDNLFELGGIQAANILGDGNVANGPDWADLFTGVCTNDPTATHGTCAERDTDNDGIPDFKEVYGGHAAGFIQDPSSAGGASDPTTFSGFGTSNKNTDPISTADCANRTPPLTGSDCTPWGWDPGNIPAKDDLTNVYSYETIPTSGDFANHLILYAGAEREDPSGDSHLDIEYFQDVVGLGTSSNFTGVRTVNDVIVSMDFLKGGALGSVTIRRWNGTTYEQIGLAGGEGCFPTPPSAPTPNEQDAICAFNNGANIDGGPWPNYNNHGTEIINLQKNAFTEIGVDLTALIGANPCISTFMGKTRSSGSFTSELKDFAGPQNFDVCQPSTTLTVNPTTKTIHSGDNVTLTFSEQNTGNETLLNPGVATDNAGCSPTGVDTTPADGFNDGDTNQDGKLDPGETWLFSCTITGVTANVTVNAYAFGTGSLSGKLITGNPTCTNSSTTICDANERASTVITVISPSTSLTKTAQVTVVYTFKETNTGNDPISGVSVTDAYGGTDTGLTPCASPAGVLQTGETHNVGDLNDNDKLDAANGATPAETWTFRCTVTSLDGADVNVTNTGTGHGTDSLNTAVPATGETDSVTVTVTHH
jgi:hypothetical protein